MRKLIICMDGTGNEIGDSETNILKFYRTFSQNETQKTHYIMGVGTNDSTSLMYRPFQKLHGVLGMAFGLGLEDDVLNAYRWLCQTYRTAEQNQEAWEEVESAKSKVPEFKDDRIYITGFSRGAYAARVLAGFINNFGLVKPNDLHLIAPAFRAYRRLTRRDVDADNNVRYKALRQFENILRPEHVPIRALMLFDTVASMIRLDWPWITIPDYWSLADLGVHANVTTNPSVRIVIHALAIDERRTFFRDLKWEEGKPYYGTRFPNTHSERPQILRQRWFAGYHSDIGGSPREDRAGIGKITALWMLDALEAAEKEADAEDLAKLNEKRAEKKQKPLKKLPGYKPGLQMRRGNKEVYLEGQAYSNYGRTNAGGYQYSAPNENAPIHNSIFTNGWKPTLGWIWAILEFIPPKAAIRREAKPVAWFRKPWPFYLPLFEPRFIPESHEVDDSVFLRRDNKTMDYDPTNMQRPTPDDVTAWWVKDVEEDSQNAAGHSPSARRDDPQSEDTNPEPAES